MWRRIAWALLALVLSFGASAVAQAQTVAVGPFTGRASGPIRRQVRAALSRTGLDVAPLSSSRGGSPEAVAQNSGADFVVRGFVARRSGRWSITVTVYRADGSEVDRATPSNRSRARAVSGAARRAAAIIEAAGPGGGGASGGPPALAESAGPVRRVVLDAVEGRGSARVQRAIEEAASDAGLEFVPTSSLYDGVSEPAEVIARAGELGVTALLRVRTERVRRRRWRATIEVLDARTIEPVGQRAITARTAPRLAAATRMRVGERVLDEYLNMTGVPQPPAPTGPNPLLAGGGDAEGAGDEGADEDESDDGAEGRYTALEIGASFVMLSRSLSYRDDIYGFMRGYELPLGVGFGLDGRWYPGAHFGDGIYAHIGLDVDFAMSLGLESRRSESVVFPTTFRRWFVGLRGRVPLGPHEISLGVGYGSHAFLIEPQGAATQGRSVNAEVPSVDYQHIRFELEGRVTFIEGLWMAGSFSYGYVLDPGQIADEFWFPNLDVGTLRAGGSLHYTFDMGLDIGLWGEYFRAWYSLNPDRFAGWIAGGALDEYGVYGVRVGYRL